MRDFRLQSSRQKLTAGGAISKPFPSDERPAISFPNWKTVLRDLPLEQQASVAREVVAFLRHCKQAHAPVSDALVKQYLATGGGTGENVKAALRWFCSLGNVRPDAEMASAGERGSHAGAEVLKSGSGQRESGSARRMRAQGRARPPRTRRGQVTRPQQSDRTKGGAIIFAEIQSRREGWRFGNFPPVIFRSAIHKQRTSAIVDGGKMKLHSA